MKDKINLKVQRDHSKNRIEIDVKLPTIIKIACFVSIVLFTIVINMSIIDIITSIK